MTLDLQLSTFDFRLLRHRLILGSLLGGAAVLCYGPALGSYFVSDDFVFLARAHDPWLSLGALDERWFRPLGLAFWKLTVELLGDSVVAHHFCNLIVHLLNCVLLYLLGRVLLKSEEAGLLAAGIFCLFPIHPEAVTWLSGRFDLLCGFFYMISLLLLTRYLEDEKKSWLGLSALGCLLALLSKEMALSLPLVAFAIVRLRRSDFSSRQVAGSLWPFFALTLLFLAIRLSVVGSLGGYAIQFRLSWSSLRILWSPLEVLCFPWNTALLDSPFRLAGLLFPVVSAFHLGALYQLRTSPRTTAFFALLLYLTALPLVNLAKVYPNLQDSRYYYLPGAVFALWLASFLGARRVRPFVISVYLVTLGALLLAHNLPWREAGKRSRVIVQELAKLPAGPRRLEGVPDHYLGAYVFRNGLDLVGRSVPEVRGEICWRTLESSAWRGKCEPEAVRYRWTGGRFEAVRRDR